ncbi:unnamed protein product [Rotaria magnacalcarata]
MDVEIIIENDHESLITTTILKSKENKNVEVVPSACEKKRKKGVFNPQWLLDSQVSSFLREYKLDSTKILCIACNETFSIHYGGKNDIDRHIKLKRHINNMKSFNINRQLITSTMKPNKEIEETAAAEGAFVYHGVKRGHSYLSQQCITNVLKTIFSSSSAIAKSMSCGRTKCNSIAVNVLAPRFTQKVLTEVKEAYFYSIMFDASNKGNIKFFPVCVQYFSKIGVKKGCIIDLIDDADELATNIFENLMTVIKKSDLPFDGLTSIGADNTNVNMGNNHTVYTLFNNEIENLFKECVFSDMKHLLNDSRNRMSVESIAAELQIRRNGSISCIDMHKYLLSQKELLEAISSNNKYTFKKQRID